MPSPPRMIRAATRARWRAWLARHHDSEREVWLVFQKGRTGRRAITYQDALDEALCFGWIDSIVRRIDDPTCARKFTPWRPNGRWSELNRRRFAQLVREGRMTPAGLAKAPPARGQAKAVTPATRPAPDTIPAYVQAALTGSPRARRNFKALSPSRRHLYVGWVDSARRPEMRLRRLDEVIGRLVRNAPLGLK